MRMFTTAPAFLDLPTTTEVRRYGFGDSRDGVRVVDAEDGRQLGIYRSAGWVTDVEDDNESANNES